MKTYEIITWDGYNADIKNHIETFEALDNDAANAYADAHYSGLEWYILDETGDDING